MFVDADRCIHTESARNIIHLISSTGNDDTDNSTAQDGNTPTTAGEGASSSLLDGEYDEEESAVAFRAAVDAWR
jgi:hypothetical protein